MADPHDKNMNMDPKLSEVVSLLDTLIPSLENNYPKDWEYTVIRDYLDFIKQFITCTPGCSQDSKAMDADLDLLLYGNNKIMEPQKIKTFAVHQKFGDDFKSSDNFVIASNDTNEVSISFNERSDCKVFRFDKVFCTDVYQVEFDHSLAKSIIQDIEMGLDCFLIVCNLASPLKSFENNAPFSHMAAIQALIKNILQELYFFIKADENIDSSLQTSFFEVHGDKIVDFLNNSEFKDLKILEVSEQNFTDIEDIVEKPIVDENDIAELFAQHTCTTVCYASMCHCFLTASLIKRNVTCDGFESIKVGKLIVVDFMKCNSNILEANIFEDSLLNTSHHSESSSRNKIFNILRPAFGGNSKTSIVVTLSSVLPSPEKDIKILQVVAQAQKMFNNPEVNLKTIIPISLQECSEEIQELQKDLNAISRGIGVKFDIVRYRSLKNSVTLENEKVKALNSYQLSLTDSVNTLKQSLIGIHVETEQIEQEIKEVEKSIENLKMDIKKEEEENNAKQKTYIADEIITIKELRDVYEINTRKQKSELIKTNKNYDELICCVDNLKREMSSLLHDIEIKQTTVKSTFDVLMTFMNSALSQCQTLHESLLTKLNNLCDVDACIKSWKGNAESLHSKLFSFMEEHNKHLDSVKLKMCSTLGLLHSSPTEIMEIIKNSRLEKEPQLLYYIHEIQVFCNTSFKTLSEISCQLEMIQNVYKTELKTITSILLSSSKTSKKFVSDVLDTLKMSLKHFEEQEFNLLQLEDMVLFYHEFKKQFNSSFINMKNSFLALKQMCLTFSSDVMSKWNEIQKDCFKISLKNDHLSENLCLINKQMSSYSENLLQQKLNTVGYSQLKDKIENVEDQTQQLVHICKEMNAATEAASELNKMGTKNEVLAVKEYITSLKNDTEKYFNSQFVAIKIDSSSFLGDLKDFQNLFSSTKEDLKNNLDFLSSSVSSLTAIYNNYQSLSCNIMQKGEVLKNSPVICDDTYAHNLSEFDFVLFDENQVSSSTPKVTKKRIMNKSYEREKLLSQIKSIVEQPMSESLNSDLDSEGNDRKDRNILTVSLPNLSTRNKVCQALPSYSRLKIPKK